MQSLSNTESIALRDGIDIAFGHWNSNLGAESVAWTLPGAVTSTSGPMEIDLGRCVADASRGIPGGG
jgi:hypothetical protein